MQRRSLVKAALTAATLTAFTFSTAVAWAGTLDFSFSFTDTVNGGGDVFGVIRGLEDNATGAASSVEVTSNANGYGIGFYFGFGDFDQFTVTAGAITQSRFSSFGDSNPSSGFVKCCSLVLFQGDPPEGNLFTLADDPLTAPSANAGNGVTFAPVLAPVPLPAGLPLVLTGLAGFAGLRMRKKRKAQV